MRILTLDSAVGACSAAIVEDACVLAQRKQPADRGQATLLAGMADSALAELAMPAAKLDLIAATIGPGSFTGIRAALALAHGIGLGAGVPVVGVTVGEVMVDSLPRLGRRKLWCAIDSRRGRVFLERNAAITAVDLDDLPFPDQPVAIAGDAAIQVAARLVARDADVMLTDVRLPQPRHIAAVAALRHAGHLPPRAAQPLYVDAPAAHPPAGGLRPPPVP
jgi:tRNA threonylcarbamoyladenosine biosynthesis protein TsaB